MKKFIIMLIASVATLAACNKKDLEAPNPNTTEPASCLDIFEEAEPEAQLDGGNVIRHRTATVNINLLNEAVSSRKITLGLFHNRKVEVEISEVEELSSNNFIITGKVSGDDTSEVTIAVNNGIIAGKVSSELYDDQYEIRPSGNGIHVIEQVVQTSNTDCIEVPDDLATPADNDLVYAQSTPVIDLLVAYTPNARIKYGGIDGIKAHIQLGVSDTNKAFADSGVVTRVRLVGTVELKSNESGNFSDDLTSLRSKTDNKWNNVHTERARLGADQVTVVATYPNNTSVAGIGYVGASAASAFTIVKASAFSMYTFSHELGHNIGLNHSDGLQNTAGKFRTIMAYGTYKRIRRYSNPDLPYNGYKTGDSTHNSAKIINANGLRMANLVAAVVPMSSPIPVPDVTSTPICQ